jgi:ribosomal-protein-alanine N-acetyltransferase
MLKFNFTPFPILETERLLLRRVDNKDVNEVFSMRSNAETMKYIPRPLVTNNEEALAHIALLDSGLEKNEAINWAITFKGENKLLGIIGFYRTKFEDYRSEIGYMLLSENHGKGIASEAVERALNYGFNKMNLHSIEAIIDPRNKESERVLLKNGFVKEGHIKENTFFNGEFLDSVIYSKIKKADL